jgi:hypothetical protein
MVGNGCCPGEVVVRYSSQLAVTVKVAMSLLKLSYIVLCV